MSASPGTRRRTHWWIVAGTLLPLALFVPIITTGREGLTEIDPLRRWCGIAYGLWLASAFVVGQISLGGLLASLASLPCRARRTMLLAQHFLIGSFASFALLLCMVAARVPFPWSIWIYLAVAGPAAAWGLERLLNVRPWRPLARSIGRWRRSWIAWLAAAGLVAWASAFIVQGLLPNSDWDSAAYHLPLARQLFRGDFWQIDPVYWWSAQPAAMHLFFGLFDALGAPQAIVPFNLLVTALSVAIVYEAARLIGGRSAARFAALIYVSQNLIWEVAITPRIDSLAATFFIACIAAMVGWVRRREQVGHIVLFGMAMGLSLGIKQINFILVGLAGAAVLVHLLRHGAPSRRQAAAAAAGVLLTLAPAGLWNVRNALATGDPVYPVWHGEVVRTEQGQIWRREQISGFVRERLPPEQAIEWELTGTPFFEAVRFARRKVESPPRLVAFWDPLLAPARHQRKPLHSLNLLLLPALLLPLVRRDLLSLSLWLVMVLGITAIGRHSFLVRYITALVPLITVASGLVLAGRGGVVVSALGMAALVRWQAAYIAEFSETAAHFGAVGQGIADWAVAWGVALLQPGTTEFAPAPHEHPWVVWLLQAGAVAALVVLLLAAYLAARRRQAGAWHRFEQRVAGGLAVLAVAYLALNTLHEYRKLATEVQPCQYLLARETHLQYLQRVGYNRVTGILEPIAFMIEQRNLGRIGATDKLLVVASVPGELLPLESLPDGTFVGRRWTAELIDAGGDLDRLAERLGQRGVRYIMVNLGIMMWQGNVHPLQRAETLQTLYSLKQFLDKHALGPPLYSKDYLLIYELRR